MVGAGLFSSYISILSDGDELIRHRYLVCFDGFRWFRDLTRVFAGKMKCKSDRPIVSPFGLHSGVAPRLAESSSSTRIGSGTASAFVCLRGIMAHIGVKMIQSTLHQLFQVHCIHEVLRLLSGCVGSFLGTWAYFSILRRHRIEEGA
jgi:hypothetical protein